MYIGNDLSLAFQGRRRDGGADFALATYLADDPCGPLDKAGGFAATGQRTLPVLNIRGTIARKPNRIEVFS